jgi:hypothetical protein
MDRRFRQRGKAVAVDPLTALLSFDRLKHLPWRQIMGVAWSFDTGLSADSPNSTIKSNPGPKRRRRSFGFLSLTLLWMISVKCQPLIIN